ncbi:response regulator transcription factor [Metabacillus idriensis]|uniref:response regulator transcription factor n=1 Tax=Metabacillus idriensis TaxID=324768 RepID=UPI0017493C4B|nr:LuxR C-terminal-related transcriptional regulator [Metabacillus idriensis]
MLDAKVREYINDAARIQDFMKRTERMVKGCVRFFPFKRATIFTYSSFSYVGEGLIQADKEKITSMHWIKEDVRYIPPIYNALANNQLQLVDLTQNNVPFPKKYINQFKLSTLAIIPISQTSNVIGCVLADQYTGRQHSIQNHVEQLSHYFQEFVAPPSNHILSNRETEVLQHLANGYCMKEMSVYMKISEFTVRDYISAVIRKLGVKHRAEAVAVGLRTGIIH